MIFRIRQDYLRSLVFGFQDALVSTTGVVVGISAAIHDPRIIVLSALVTVSVEALSMAAGQYLSEKAVHELPNSHHEDKLITGSLFMFFSYIIGGFIPIIPIFFTIYPYSSILSVVFAFIGLFVLVFLRAKLFTGKIWRSAIEMLFVGGLATFVGLLVGSIFPK
ncbi:MAG: VIT1/CCC1 transporter family protein [Bacteriovorax sp.]|nr:VIT1/CCC1 transporter family protein [Bacteriovorax sp.]